MNNNKRWKFTGGPKDGEEEYLIISPQSTQFRDLISEEYTLDEENAEVRYHEVRYLVNHELGLLIYAPFPGEEQDV